MIKLRSEPKELSEKEVISMLESHNMYDSTSNKNAKGISHNYKKTNEIIFDEATGLMWQQSGSDEDLMIKEAEDYINDLNKATYGGYNDWRLPTLEEAMSLMEPVKKNERHFNPMFDDTQEWIWTCDTTKGFYWIIYFYGGTCRYYIDYNHHCYVRAVRNVQPSV